MELNTTLQEKKTAGLGQSIASLVLAGNALTCALGSISRDFGWVYNIFGIGCAIAGMILANKGIKKAIAGNTSYGMANAGRTISILSWIASVILFIINVAR
jgi:uncharacterized membrane protein